MFDYEVAFSFAGEDRNYVESLAILLRKKNIDVFYDEFETATLWGKDLFQYLHDIYSKKSKYCIIFISEHYVNKKWTIHELKSAQDRAFNQNTEYILPIKMDNTEVPGILSTTGLIDSKNKSLEEIAELIQMKILASTSLKPINNYLEGFSCDENYVIWLLPRGFLLIDNFISDEITDWHIKVHYFDYSGDLMLGTFFNKGYDIDHTEDLHKTWSSIRIPEGDWNFALTVFLFIRDILNGRFGTDIKRAINIYSEFEGQILLIENEKRLFVPSLPVYYMKENKNGLIRDLIFELKEMRKQEISIVKIKRIRRDAYNICYQLLAQKSHLFFVKEITEKFDENFTNLKLKNWLEEYTNILDEAKEYV